MVTDFEKKYGVLPGMTNVIAKENVFGPSKGKLLNTEMADGFHTYVAKGLFASTRGRPDSHTVVLLMMTRVKEPRESDWEKLLHYMRFMKHTKDAVLTLSADNLHVIKWYVDASFAVHPDSRSH